MNTLKSVVTASLLVAMSVPALAQSTGKSSTTSQTTTKHRAAARKTAPKQDATAAQIQALRQEMQAQIDELKQQLADRDAKLQATQTSVQTAQEQTAETNAKLQSIVAESQSNKESLDTLQSKVTDMVATTSGLSNTLITTQANLRESVESPTTLHYKGITITPVAFFAFETVWRSRSLASDVNTPFNSTPYMGAGMAHVSELNFSGRQSRVGALFEGNTGPFKLSGYVEADFLSAGATSNENQSNSYTLRQRQIWGQAATQGGFAVTGGQMWSLVTETKKSTDNRTENLPMTIDAQYHVGFSWARQPAIRFQQKIGKWTAAASLEQAEYIYSASNSPNNFFIGSAGTGGGLYNLTANYSNNVAPDVVVKGTYDGKLGHFEAGGIARWFRDRYYPNGVGGTGSSAGAVNDTKTGGGFFANIRMPATKYLDVGVHMMTGTGVGRYGTSTLPDITVHPDGTLAPIKSDQGLISLEAHPMPKLDIFGYAGGEYAQRTTYRNASGVLVGYAPVSGNNAGCNVETLPTAAGNGLAGSAPYGPGTPANCLGATRAVIEGTAGITYRLYSNPRFGRLQYQVQYSYLTREAWTGQGGAPKGTNNMVFTGMRYYIP
ncbi:MAG: hypothetical protein PW789_05380 [Edaphobacter sp.]|uniref:hypothetical protein n=1 Tax=Edaphobacter sp. TaxID=1934404 RepID=UPI0023864F0C|nr:hypothetical protein [Edaphobacter sp.]MDE1176022.1 hypothetical protein [Edaphobacter sp.]